MSWTRPGARVRALAWLPVVAYSGLIFYLSSRPVRVQTGWKLPGFDKLIHVVEYGGWALLFLVGLLATSPRIRARPAFFLAALAATAYGLSDEVHQAFVPQREADGFDLLADAVGAMLGAGFGLSVRAVLRRRAAARGGAGRRGAARGDILDKSGRESE
jgi:VanZ family protein